MFSYSTQDSHLTNKSSSYALVIKSKIKVQILMKGGWFFLTVVNIICNVMSQMTNIKLCRL